mmetsp:Transcript_15557/g.13287  ORF Transcript_15557/g.13287 Transcript_15557/m.13287 type:complete len:141 (+) Transcript_15557:91-513(+)
MPHLSNAKSVKPAIGTDPEFGLTREVGSLQLVKKIADSQFSVYLANDQTYNRKYAMKLFPVRGGELHSSYLNEKRFSNLCHKNISSVIPMADKVINISQKGKSLKASFILYDLAENRDMYEVFQNGAFEGDEKLARSIFR